MLHNKKGFTIIELVAVMVVLAIVATYAISKMIGMTEAAKDNGIDVAVNELNARENLAWQNALLDQDKIDGVAYSTIDDLAWYYVTNLSNDHIDLDNSNVDNPAYSWGEAGSYDCTQLGGTLTFQDLPASLTRSPATLEQGAWWKRN